MTTTDHKPSAAFWITVALLAVLAGYPLSFGPACWWFSKPKITLDGSKGSFYVSGLLIDLLPRAPQVYWPLGWTARYGPRPASAILVWYATAAHTRSVVLPTDRGGSGWRAR